MATEPQRPIGVMLLDYGPVEAPASLDAAIERSGDPKRFQRSSKFAAYLRRQQSLQEKFFKTGGDMSQFRAEEWA